MELLQETFLTRTFSEFISQAKFLKEHMSFAQRRFVTQFPQVWIVYNLIAID